MLGEVLADRAYVDGVKVFEQADETGNTPARSLRAPA
jgi:hypothetical protein